VAIFDKLVGLWCHYRSVFFGFQHSSCFETLLLLLVVMVL
jgi:hypothetical protein